MCTRQHPNIKKAGRYPIRVYVGPTKNLLQDDRETPSKIRRHNLPAGYISIPGAKELNLKLGRFT